ncbi:unnamed protein product [Alopecurus aequalis]
MPSGRRRRHGRAQSSSPPPPPHHHPPPPPPHHHPPPPKPQRTSSHGNLQPTPASAWTADQRPNWFGLRVPPDGREIRVYQDRHGTLMTYHDGQIRPVAHVLREYQPARRAAYEALPLPLPPPHASPPTGYDRPTWHEESEIETKLEETTLEEKASSSMPQTTRHEESEIKTTLEKTASSSMPQTTRFQMPDLLSLKHDMDLLASSCISTIVPTGLMVQYFVRVDNDGFIHTYPDRGGPFESVQEVQEGIDSHHAVQRKNLCMDGLTDEERAIRCALYWYHDGTRKHSQEAFDSCTTDIPIDELVKAILDKFNEDNGLVGDLAYELVDIVSHNSCFDGKDCIYRSYDHFNLTIKTKGAANSALYFAEVTCMDGDNGDYEAYVLTCICMVKPEDDGECHVCGAEMKHPTHDEYNHGRPQKSRGHGRHRSPAFGEALFEKLFAVRDEAWLKEEEARVTRVIKEGMEDRRKSEAERKLKAERKLEVDSKREDHREEDKCVVP